MTGKIARLVRDKGFGFLAAEIGGEDVFFHRSCVENSTFDGLREGQRVTFEFTDSPKGPRAVFVRPA